MMKKGKAAGPTAIVSEMIMADKDCNMEWLTSQCNVIIVKGESVMTGRIVLCYQGKEMQGNVGRTER